MTLELERASTTETVAEARLGSLGSELTETQRAELADRLRAGGVPHEDMRDWLELVDALGELRVVDGVDWQENIGRIAEMLVHTDGAPAVLFDHIPGYPAGYRVLTNAQGERPRLAVSLGLAADISAFDLMDAWERLMDTVKPIPPAFVADGPIAQNVFEGDDIDLWKFPTPKWHEQDGGRYLGTGVCVITKDPDSDWINMGTYRVMIHDRNRTGLYISPGKHGRMHRDKAFEKGEPLPVVVVPGMDPLWNAVSVNGGRIILELGDVSANIWVKDFN